MAFIVAAILLSPLALLVIYLAWFHWPRTGTHLYDHHHRALMHNMNERGLTGDQMVEEMTFRNTMARIRRRATEAAKANPHRFMDGLSSVVKEETKALAMHDRRLARRVADVVRKAPLSDILYDDALKAIETTHRPARHIVPNADHIAAVKTVR